MPRMINEDWKQFIIINQDSRNILILVIGSLELNYGHVSVLKYCWASLLTGTVVGTGNTILSKVESSHPSVYTDNSSIAL